MYVGIKLLAFNSQQFYYIYDARGKSSKSGGTFAADIIYTYGMVSWIIKIQNIIAEGIIWQEQLIRKPDYQPLRR